MLRSQKYNEINIECSQWKKFIFTKPYLFHMIALQYSFPPSLACSNQNCQVVNDFTLGFTKHLFERIG